MEALIVLVAVQIFITLLFAPLMIDVSGHATLNLMQAELDVGLYFARVLRLRLRSVDGALNLTVNGKKTYKRPKLSDIPPSLISRAARAGISADGRFTLRIGLDDMMLSALICGAVLAALAPITRNVSTYIGERQGLDADIEIKIKLNLAQIAELTFGGKDAT